MHSCKLCLTEAIPERCPDFHFDWEEEDHPYSQTREGPDRPIPQEDTPTVVNRKTKGDNHG